MPEILIYGYGNPGRYDDGIGPLIAERIESWAEKNNLSNITVDSNYQLNIEDAYSIKDYDIVIFVDASIEAIKSYCFTSVEPSEKVEFTMHAVSPSFVLDLCRKIYDTTPEVFLLHVKGYEFELKEGMSVKAMANAERSLEFLKKLILEPENISRSKTEC